MAMRIEWQEWFWQKQLNNNRICNPRGRISLSLISLSEREKLTFVEFVTIDEDRRIFVVTPSPCLPYFVSCDSASIFSSADLISLSVVAYCEDEKMSSTTYAQTELLIGQSQGQTMQLIWNLNLTMQGIQIANCDPIV